MHGQTHAKYLQNKTSTLLLHCKLLQKASLFREKRTCSSNFHTFSLSIDFNPFARQKSLLLTQNSFQLETKHSYKYFIQTLNFRFNFNVNRFLHEGTQEAFQYHLNTNCAPTLQMFYSRIEKQCEKQCQMNGTTKEQKNTNMNQLIYFKFFRLPVVSHSLNHFTYRKQSAIGYLVSKLIV